MKSSVQNSTLELEPLQFQFKELIDWDIWKQQALPRIEYAAALGLRSLIQLQPHNGLAVIVGASPSIVEHKKQIKGMQFEEGTAIFSVNGAHHWLVKNGIIPNIHVLFEHDLENSEQALGGSPNSDVTYYICSHCPQNVFDDLAAYKRVVWHCSSPFEDYQEAIHKHFPGQFMVSGGYSTFFRTLTIAMLLGFRQFEIFGCDSSFTETPYVAGYQQQTKEETVSVYGVGPDGEAKKFTTIGGLAFQAAEFAKFCEHHHHELKIKIHGDGLLNFVHKTRYPEQYIGDI